uniref:Potassium/proton antiporter CemA n=1 Tax=Equisetum arvense TaxID=3258 RepID=E3T2T4_EQUAR|nr:chloroplast envelope membrane protein [Equisetum arvense]ADA63572.1 chloroplast envelope membrane protein [Equisetum arvense]
MKLDWWKPFEWFYDIPFRSLERAYMVGKRMQEMEKFFFSYGAKKISSGYQWKTFILFMNMEFNYCIFIIYWSLLECKLSLIIATFWYRVKRNLFNIFFISSFSSKNTRKSRVAKNLLSKKKIIYEKKENRKEDEFYEKSNSFRDDSSFSSRTVIALKLKRIREMNQKLSSIESILTALEQNRTFSFSDNLEKKFFIAESNEYFGPPIAAYESISLVPRSILRTLFRFQLELAGKSSSLVLDEFWLAKYQASASLQYLGCLIILPYTTSYFLENWILKPSITIWWNTAQLRIFLNKVQEEKALERLQNVEEFLWLNTLLRDPIEEESKNFDTKVYEQTINLVKIYNEDCIGIILHLATDLIRLITVIVLFIVGRKQLAILNSWLQELFYSLSDTMKAFFIILSTDLCIGFHSPHGWEIVISSFLEYLGFSQNTYIISCFVSTFPVILDTVSKYWIFRHLNRISPSIVATYHSMNE